MAGGDRFLHGQRGGIAFCCSFVVGGNTPILPAVHAHGRRFRGVAAVRCAGNILPLAPLAHLPLVSWGGIAAGRHGKFCGFPSRNSFCLGLSCDRGRDGQINVYAVLNRSVAGQLAAPRDGAVAGNALIVAVVDQCTVLDLSTPI